jgi:hypothetical protein
MSNTGATSEATVAKRIGQFKAIEAKLEEMDKAFEKQKEPLLKVKALLQGYFEQILSSTGAQSIATPLGTVHWTHRNTASLQDAALFMDFVIKNQMFDLMDRRANAVAVREFVEKTGTAPDAIGVKLNSIRTVGVTKPAAKKAK